MAVIKKKELKAMKPEELEKKADELLLELVKENAKISVGATVTSPGRLREIKRTIARIKTMQHLGEGDDKLE